MATIEDVTIIVSVLTDDEKTILKDCIKHGWWGDGDYEFLDEDGKVETAHMDGFCTNDAKDGGHFSGRKVSAMFRSIYKKLCPFQHTIGRYISHCSDWWGDGRGDMLFIREEYSDTFKEWARE